jgi:hypothetical protein
MTKLKFADGLDLPADESLVQKFGFIGRSGSGKSYAAMRLAELFLDAGSQIIALDWVGIWWSLRLAANGKDVGFPNVYIFGGEHADVDLRPESGALMADLVVDKHISVVLDVMHFRKAERTRFATAFAEQFFHRKKTARTACHLFIEEAQAYLPQMVRGEEARMVGVFEDIGKVGRNYGIGNSLISQRPQAINKDVLNQIEVLLAFQTNGPQERKAIAGWTAENTTAGAAMMQDLPKLQVGDALVWSPQWLRIADKVHISKRETYDASSTPTARAKAIKPKTLAPADLEQLGEQIAATIERSKADDPRELRKRIADLEKQVKSTPVLPAPAKEKRIEVPILKDGQIARLEKICERLAKAQDEIRDFEAIIGQEVSTLADAIRSTRAAVHPGRLPEHSALARGLDRAGAFSAASERAAVSQDRVHADVRRRAPTGRSASRLIPVDVNGNISVGERAVLIAAAQYQDTLTREQASILTGYKRSTRDTYIQRLQAKGYLVPGGGTVVATPAGVAALGADYEPLPTGRDLQAYWLQRLPQGEAAILEAAIAEYPKAVDRDALSDRTGFKRSTRDTYIQRLQARQLLARGGGPVTASDSLF